MPAGFDTFREALRSGVEIYHALADILQGRSLSTSVGDEGGFAPSLDDNRDAVALVIEAIERAGYRPGEQCFIALDVAASELDKQKYPSDRLIGIYEDWVAEYPIVSIEDGIAEDEWDDWQSLSSAIGGSVQLVGDDLFTTNTELIRKGISMNAGNAVAYQAEPDRHGDRDTERGKYDAGCWLGCGHQPPLRRDRGHDDSRPRSRH